jgi:hypothetical protein
MHLRQTFYFAGRVYYFPHCDRYWVYSTSVLHRGCYPAKYLDVNISWGASQTRLRGVVVNGLILSMRDAISLHFFVWKFQLIISQDASDYYR